MSAAVRKTSANPRNSSIPHPGRVRAVRMQPVDGARHCAACLIDASAMLSGRSFRSAECPDPFRRPGHRPRPGRLPSAAIRNRRTATGPLHRIRSRGAYCASLRARGGSVCRTIGRSVGARKIVRHCAPQTDQGMRLDSPEDPGRRDKAICPAHDTHNRGMDSLQTRASRHCIQGTGTHGMKREWLQVDAGLATLRQRRGPFAAG